MAGNPLASLPGLPQRPSLARSSASETRLTQPGIEGARSRKLNSAPTAAFRIKGWRVGVGGGKQGAAEWQRRCAGDLELGYGGRVRCHQLVEGSLNFDRAAAQSSFLDPVVDRRGGRPDFGGELIDRPFVWATLGDGPRRLASISPAPIK